PHSWATARPTPPLAPVTTTTLSFMVLPFAGSDASRTRAATGHAPVQDHGQDHGAGSWGFPWETP
ncbi:hypothetical protein ACFQ08_08560, partial [Streptosporangium algeriense]